MSKIVDDFMAGVCYDGSMKKARREWPEQMSKIVDDMADKVCYASTMKIGPEEIRESRSLGGLIPPGLFLCPEGGG